MNSFCDCTYCTVNVVYHTVNYDGLVVVAKLRKQSKGTNLGLENGVCYFFVRVNAHCSETHDCCLYYLSLISLRNRCCCTPRNHYVFPRKHMYGCGLVLILLASGQYAESVRVITKCHACGQNATDPGDVKEYRTKFTPCEQGDPSTWLVSVHCTFGCATYIRGPSAVRLDPVQCSSIMHTAFF